MTEIAERTASPANDDLDKPIWGARSIGVEINKGEAATFHLLETGKIPATKIGRQWCTTRRRLRNHFAQG
jgi:hypothetical protein